MTLHWLLRRQLLLLRLLTVEASSKAKKSMLDRLRAVRLAMTLSVSWTVSEENRSTVELELVAATSAAAGATVSVLAAMWG